MEQLGSMAVFCRDLLRKATFASGLAPNSASSLGDRWTACIGPATKSSWAAGGLVISPITEFAAPDYSHGFVP